MKTLTSKDSLSRQVPKGFQKEFNAIVQAEREHPYFQFLLRELNVVNPDMLRLFEYGVTRLPNELDRPDYSLGYYFLILSEIADVTAELKTLADDCMTYCNDDNFLFSSFHKSRLQKRFFSLRK